MAKKATDEEIGEFRNSFASGALTVEEIAARKQVSISTARRWVGGRSNQTPASTVCQPATQPVAEARNWNRERWVDVILAGVSIVSLLISLISIWFNVKLQRDISAEKVISDSYSTFYTFDRLALEHKNVSHLFAGPKYYRLVKSQVILATRGSNPSTMAGYLLEERQAASFIFDYFEEMVLRRARAVDVGDQEQLQFIDLSLNYLSKNALQNPRLLWFWEESGGDLCSDYDAKTVQYFDANVGSKSQLAARADANGPFDTSQKS